MNRHAMAGCSFKTKGGGGRSVARSGNRISRFSRYLWLAFAMFVVFATAFVVYAWSEKQIDRANELRLQSYLLANELRQSSDDLTRMVRTYVVTGNPVYKEQYQEVLDIREGKKARPVDYHDVYWDLVLADGGQRPRPPGAAAPLLELMRQSGFTKEEFARLAEAKMNSDELTITELAAMALIESANPPTDADRGKAIRMLNDPAYHEAKARIMLPINELYRTMEQRTRDSVQNAITHATRMRVAFVIFGLLLVALLFSMRRSLQAILGGSVDELYTRIARLGSGDFSCVMSVSKGAENSVLGWLSETQINLARIDDRRRLAEEKVQNATKELMLSEETLRATFRQASVGITVTSLDLHYLEVNDQYCEIVGYTREELLGGMTVTAMSLPDAGDAIATASGKLMSGEVQSDSREIRLKRKDGSVIWAMSAISLVRDADGKPKHFVSVTQDISGNKLAQERLLHLAHYDHLTGLPNRALFYDRLQQALAQARRNGWISAVLFVDLDRFKIVNDTLGHAHGDEVLQKVAERLTRCVRSGDTVGRLGGDEFAIILNELAASENAGVVAQNVLKVLSDPFAVDGNEVHATASIGIAIYPADSANVDTLISDADTAMYSAKAAGRNGFRYYTSEMNERALEKVQLERKLRRALERDEFLLHFQPKMDIASGEIAGFEALLRWQPPGSALVPPERFIPLLEETGLIVPVGEWVLRAACAQVSQWSAAHLRPVPIAVNLSARQFHQQDLCAVVKKSLKEHGVAAGFIELEITESAAMRNPETSIATLRELKALGVHLSIDDFGTGYSSLSYLKRLPVDTVKIDRSFITDLATNPDDASIAQAIINMAHNLRLKVVAEGVETASQLSFLSSHGCDQMQGYYFARPLPANEVTQMLQENRQLQRPEGRADNGERTLLLLDDEENILSSLKRLLRRDHYRIFTALNAQAAFEILANHKVGVIVSDQRMPGVTGVEFLRRVKELYPGSVRMVLSGFTDLESVTEAINQGAIYRFLTKPWDDALLRAHIGQAFRRYASRQENDRAQRDAAVKVGELSRENRSLHILLAQCEAGIASGTDGRTT
jgi:diguanylate cyclase (GGDEF)-like protein/PAS domain S-box-containing protein